MQLDLFRIFKNKDPKAKALETTPVKSLFRTEKEVIALNEKIEVEVARRSYQKRWKLWVHPSGKVRVTVNKKVSLKQVKRWLLSMQPWIEKGLANGEKLREKYPPKKYIDGENFPFIGKDYRLRINPALKTDVYGDIMEINLGVPVETSTALKQEKLQMLYKKQARYLIPERLDYWSECMGLKYSRLSLRGQKTRWGSCSSRGEISLNWKLVAAPLEVLDYVVIHELAHLTHPNHSKEFWGLVEAYCPEYKGLKRWLRDNQYGFEFL